MAEKTDTRTEFEQDDEALVMFYLDILKYVQHHTGRKIGSYKIADHIFTCLLKANGGEK